MLNNPVLSTPATFGDAMRAGGRAVRNYCILFAIIYTAIMHERGRLLWLYVPAIIGVGFWMFVRVLAVLQYYRNMNRDFNDIVDAFSTIIGTYLFMSIAFTASSIVVEGSVKLYVMLRKYIKGRGLAN